MVFPFKEKEFPHKSLYSCVIVFLLYLLKFIHNYIEFFPTGSNLAQKWKLSKGTIPIRRISMQELLRATSLEHFRREGPRTSSIVNSTNDKSSDNNGSKIQVFPPPNYSVIILYKSLLIDI